MLVACTDERCGVRTSGLLWSRSSPHVSHDCTRFHRSTLSSGSRTTHLHTHTRRTRAWYCKISWCSGYGHPQQTTWSTQHHFLSTRCDCQMRRLEALAATAQRAQECRCRRSTMRYAGRSLRSTEKWLTTTTITPNVDESRLRILSEEPALANSRAQLRCHALQ